jgi:hypothetical protein
VTTVLVSFRRMFDELHAAGGKSMRLWLHTDGASTPAYSGNLVSGPGAGASAGGSVYRYARKQRKTPLSRPAK